MATRAAITFDAEHPDRPTDPGLERAILDALRRLDVKATFFMQGRWVEAFPGRARAVADGGHLIGNHSFYHARMPLLTEAGFAEDIRAAEQVIGDIVKVDPKPWFRCPFGTGMDDPALLARLDGLGYRHAGWNVDGLDWDPARSLDTLVETIVDGVLQADDVAVVLLHSWPRPTAEAITRAVPRLRDAGVEFVRVDALSASSLSAAVPAPSAPGAS